MTSVTPDAEPEYPADAARAFAAMRYLVLEQDDPRRQVADATGISFVRAKALRYLATRPPLRMTELAAVMFTDKPYTTLIVDDLEKRGLVVRAVDPDDRRCKTVNITEAGRVVAAEADRLLSRPAPGLLRLDADELATLARLLEKASEGESPESRVEGLDPSRWRAH